MDIKHKTVTLYLKIFWESSVQALSALTGNKLRTFLSLLGITIGIFCIITVKSAVDSLQKNIVDGFSELGSDVIYLDRMPWNEDPGMNFWKYAKRPTPSFEDYNIIQKKSKLAENAAFVVITAGHTVKYQSHYISNTFIMGSTFDYNKVQDIKIEEGRYFTQSEYNSGSNKVILGYKIYNELFPTGNGLSQNVKLFGQNFQVIGYLESEGDNVFNFLNFDEVIWLNYNNLKKFVSTKEDSSTGKLLVIQAGKKTDLQELKGEITGIIRASRRLKPLEGDNFALNELSMLSQVLDNVFKVLNIAGFIIGIFALIVGMVSVANIMFVSVKERTNIIGIKKALGAQRKVILMEFLIESVILCVIGGIIGLVLVFISLKLISLAIPFQMSMSLGNMIVGVVTSIIVGILSGLIPAIQASGLDPVEAIRA